MGDCTVGKSDEQWEIESAASTIIEAQAIKADKKKWAKVKKELAKRVEAAQRAAREAGVKVGMKKAFPKKD